MPDIPSLLEALQSATPEPAARELKRLAERDLQLLAPYAAKVLNLAIETEDLRTRWNLVVILGLIPLGGSTREATIDWLFERLQDPSPFTQTFALQSLWNLSANDIGLRQRLLPIAQRFAETGTPAMRVRASKLMRN